MKQTKIYYLSLLALLLIISGIVTVNFAQQNKQLRDVDAQPLIEKMYADISGFNIDGSETTMIEKNGGAPTYGEITYDSAKKLLSKLNLIQDDVFYDFGSGVGKMVIQTYLTTPVKKAVGVELSPTRIKHARAIKQQLQNKGKLTKNRLLDFKEQNISDVMVNDATIVYMCSTCYSFDLMQKIVDKLAQLKKGVLVITLKKLPKHSNFKLIDTYHLPMTWSSNVAVYIYQLV